MDKIYSCSYTLETLVGMVKQYMQTDGIMRDKLFKAGKKMHSLKQRLVEEQGKNDKLHRQLEILSSELASRTQEIKQVETKSQYLEKVLAEIRDMQRNEVLTYEAEYERIQK